jgi:hypothetical protein
MEIDVHMCRLYVDEAKFAETCSTYAHCVRADQRSEIGSPRGDQLNVVSPNARLLLPERTDLTARSR